MSEMAPGQAPELVVNGREAVITLRRPQVANRLEFADLETIRGYLREVNAMEHVLVLHLRAEGRHFCSGFNIHSVGAGNIGEAFEALAGELETARPVTIAAVNGGVYGGATDLALACDFRYGVTHSQMFVPAAKLGLLFYQGGLHRYVSRLGVNVAKRLLLTGASFDAGQMRDCGFLDEVVEPARLEEVTGALGAQLGGMAPLALLGMKKHLTRIAAGRFDAVDYAKDLARADASDDLREGALAWQEKRAPAFKGC
ncbi:enoyl-CoA hydratase/isomerase family protein [Paraburkholderia youngii]|uniref:enoyl-CoA hydratase/isomerase family protein n=1 Tax=Paraburkholderia youngii TaxID=2782701 RepID=UPI0015915CAE|nr:enoyl-CoA hydratase/isomerase family protein [Paraburkholderia youngii]NUX58931.1 enoyl-CoA hydratase/isomerase family protein [Paraburkholderia youngii]